MSLKASILRFLRSEDGPTAVEYAVLLSLILLVCVVAIQSLGNETSAGFTNVRDRIDEAIQQGE